VRKSRAAAAETKAGIVEAASRAFKRHGFDGVGVAELMAEAGLSHGAAYKHFPSKQALAAACLQAAADVSVSRALRARSAKGWMARYLSADRVADAGDGCAFAALAVDVARAEDAGLREVFAEGLAAFVDALAESTGVERDAAVRMVAMGVGALVLMRAGGGEDLRAACLLESRGG
jgi:TetR/AcrR family transcriptional repressor of nem operon